MCCVILTETIARGNTNKPCIGPKSGSHALLQSSQEANTILELLSPFIPVEDIACVVLEVEYSS